MEKLNEKHLSLPFLQSETTLFKGPISNTIPDEQTTIGQVLLRIMNGYWKNQVTNVRELKIGLRVHKKWKIRVFGAELRKSFLTLLFQSPAKGAGT